LKHPFPILERELKKNLHLNGASHEAGTHFFIMLDQFEQDPKFDPERWLKSPDENPYYSIPFAAGPRMCIGKPIAMELLVELLKSFLLEIPDEKTKPALGHLYSGRDNDGESSKAESAYQLKTFSRALWRSFRLRANSTKPLTCPARPQYEPPVRNAF
jgi:cytochrome P450